MADFFLKQGDLLPKLAATFTDGTGAAVNLAGCTVSLRIRAFGIGTVTAILPCAIVDAAAGKAEHTWLAGETSVAGDFQADFLITTPTGIMTIPNDKSLVLSIASGLS